MGFSTGLRRRLTLGLVLGLLAAGVALGQSRSDDQPVVGIYAPCNAPVSAIKWIRVAPANETAHLDRWCAGVGPPLVRSVPPAIPPAPEIPVLVTWNTHEGGDIGVVAGRLKLAAYYVPSMRNGEPGVTTEDRGNAILSTLPLSNLTAIELPLERQRRVALQATVSVPGPDGGALPLHLVCTHFTNMVMHHLWVLSESGRLRQARALSQVLPAEGALIVAGDFNAWFGGRDAAVRELAKVVPHVSSEDRRATFGPMRLDHVLARLPSGWRTTVIQMRPSR